MAHEVFTDGSFIWNAVDLSDHVREIRLRENTEFAQEQRMGSTVNVRHPVIKDWGLEIILYQDFASSEVDATLSADALAKTARTWTVRKNKASAISATNPDYTATGYISEYEPLHGAFGELLGTRILVVPGGSAPDLVRDVTP